LVILEHKNSLITFSSPGAGCSVIQILLGTQNINPFPLCCLAQDTSGSTILPLLRKLSWGL